MKVQVKWGRQTFKDLELNLQEPPSTFKDHLFKLTGVVPERQKLLFRGSAIKDSWENVCITANCSLLLLGSADELPSEPQVRTVFLEDMSESELAKASNLPAGLQNIGNTCYLNATLQCLGTVPELKAALKSISFCYGETTKENLAHALKVQYSLMDKGVTSIPLAVISSFQGLFSHFAEKDSSGKFRQQDANEFWVELLNVLNDILSDMGNDLINMFFSGEFEVTYVCAESDLEPQVVNKERFYQVSCFINPDIRHIQAGLESTLHESMTKYSDILGRDAIFEKKCKIDRLPCYLTIQLVRFYYKEREKISAKVLRDVKFPLYYDAYTLCSADFQKKLDPMREKIKAYEDEIAKNKDSQLDFPVATSFDNDIGSNNSGFYELQAVLTHQGRSSSSGHYVAWVKHNEIWAKCDDANISIVPEDAILKLSGGGDWHTAYILLYGPIMKVSSFYSYQSKSTK